MKKEIVLNAVAIGLLVSFTVLAQSSPNYVRTTTYLDESTPIVSTTFSDGLGKKIQSQVIINGAPLSIDLISGNYFDPAGRPWRTVKAFSTTEAFHDYLPDGGVGNSLIDKANLYFNNDSAFSETQYYDDPLERVKAVGQPGKDFNLANPAKHFQKSWYFGVKLSPNSSEDPNALLDTSCFIKTSELIKSTVEATLDAPGFNMTNAVYFLTVNRDPNGKFSQELKDIFGNTFKTWSTPDITSASQQIKASYIFDIVGKLNKETQPVPDLTDPGNVLLPSQYTYNTLGQLSSKITPDAGTTSFRYDDAGRILFSQNQKQKDFSTTSLCSSLGSNGLEVFTIYSYDNLGRTLTIGENNNDSLKFLSGVIPQPVPAGLIRVENHYDSANGLLPLKNGVSYGTIIDSIIPLLSNLRGRLVFTVAYNDTACPCSGGITYDPTTKVVDIFSYDDEGRINKKFKIIPGLPVQAFTFTYNLQGKVVSQKYFAAFAGTLGGATSVTTFSYDSNGRLASINKGSEFSVRPYVTYSYSQTNLLTKRTFARSGVDQNFDLNYSYNIRDWVNKIFNISDSTIPQYSEKLAYNDASSLINSSLVSSLQYNGNIAASEFTYPTTAPLKPLSLAYTYDDVNRLTNVVTGATGTVDSNLKQDKFKEAFLYDNVGRLTKKVEGASGTSSTDPKYYYYPQSSKLRGIKGNEWIEDSYVYDGNGNMILDKNKKMYITYDWRDMPEYFKFLNQNPEQRSDTLDFSKCKMISEVRMQYDASGNRVLKTTQAPLAP